MSVIHVPGSCESLGDFSRKLARAHGREWSRITMGECDAWHSIAAKLMVSLTHGWRGHPC